MIIFQFFRGGFRQLENLTADVIDNKNFATFVDGEARDPRDLREAYKD